MNCAHKRLVGVVVACLLLWAGGLVRAGEPDNFLANGSFETLDKGGWPLGWRLSSQPTDEQAAGMRGFIDTEVRHHGDQSLRIEARGVTERYAGLMHDSIDLDGPATYRFSGWFKAQDYAITPDPEAGPAVHAFWFWVHVRGTDQRLVSASLAVGQDGTFDWRYVENDFKVPCPVTLHPGAWKGFNGTVWYDDIRIERVGELRTTQTERGPDVKTLVDAFPDAIHSRDDTFAVLYAPPVKKITRRIRAAEGALSAGPRAALSLARNEAEALQIVLAPLTDAPVTVEWYTSELRHRDSGRVLLDAVTVQPVGYMGYSDDEKLVTEPWPDILLPEADVVLQPNCLQPLWLEVLVPAAAPAGMYEATLTILLKGEPVATVPVDITVYDFTLPSAPTLPTAMSSHTRAGQRVLLEHRVGLSYTCLPLVGFSRYDGDFWRHELEFERVRPAVDEILALIEAYGGRQFCVEIPRFPGTFPGGANSIGGFQRIAPTYTPEQQEYIVRYYRDYARYLKDRGLFQHAWVYLFDEPEESAFDTIRFDRELIRRADPDLRCSVVGHLWPEFAGVVDLWCPHILDFEEPEALVRMRERQAAGEAVWGYNTCEEPPYAAWNVNPDCDLLSTRLLFWIVRKYGFDGFLHWTSDRATSPVVRLGNSTDCYLPKGPGAYIFGAGQLQYSKPVLKSMLNPDTYLIDNMVPSIRLKAIRDGLEDHDYFVLLAERLEQARKSGRRDAAIEAAAKLAAVPPEIATSFTEFTSNAELVLKYRDLMARAIETLGETE